jgi:hypothetical protein
MMFFDEVVAVNNKAQRLFYTFALSGNMKFALWQSSG